MLNITSKVSIFITFVSANAAHHVKKGKGKSRFIGLFQYCGRSAYCILIPNKFPLSSPETPRIIQMRETSTSEYGNYY